MLYIIAFLFSILTIIKPLEGSLGVLSFDGTELEIKSLEDSLGVAFCNGDEDEIEVELQFRDGTELEARIIGNFRLCGDSRESMITLRDYLIINRNNLEHPLAGISQIKLTQGIAKVGNTVKTAPAIFNVIYVDLNDLSTFIKSQADNFARIFRNGKYFRHEEEEYDLCNLIFKSNPNVSTEIIAEHFSAEQAQVLYQIWLHRPGADFTQAEFDKAMAMISAAENKTQDGYLAELQKNFSEPRAWAIYQNWPHRPGANFTQAEFDRAMAMIPAAENKTQNGYLAELQKNFSEARTLALYQNWPHRPGADFTQAEANKTTWLMQKSKAKSEQGYLKVLQEVFSAERASALLGAFIRGDLIEGVELENEVNARKGA